ncbi:Acg family FMN-binding oxidoreductase [Ferribacterium limneticum]|uniref:Acg family FMN-binding oxidoreductase n=1 Tax=Ferribacterium limneticum TaxID=76259 RepID=UPI001CF8CD8C|nr:Tat pathway signal protein [Ferribacterium limneticum]UCV23849.1 Tat pathway signal protein [Ferribacterium limneticum]
MLRRRQFVVGAGALAVAAPFLVGCSSGSPVEDAARRLRRPGAVGTGDRALLLGELVRHATLAPSSHNTQCWKFRVQEGLITIAPDLSRRCPAVDPDDHHLFVSLGCASENLAQAALANGLQAGASFDPAGDGAVAVRLEATKAHVSPLFQAIAERQCTRGDYDGRPLSTAELRLLEQAGSGNGVRLLLLTERSVMETVLDYVLAANTAQIDDPAFIAELKMWIRFSNDEAIRTGDGLFAGATGNPAVPRWLGSPMMGLFFTAKSENERYARQIRNSAGIAVFVSEVSDKAHWVETGRCYERFALQATALGIRNALLNQPVEVAALRPQFAAAIGLGDRRPDLVVRFGRGPSMPMSMRRPVEAVLV